MCLCPCVCVRAPVRTWGEEQGHRTIVTYQSFPFSSPIYLFRLLGATWKRKMQKKTNLGREKMWFCFYFFPRSIEMIEQQNLFFSFTTFASWFNLTWFLSFNSKQSNMKYFLPLFFIVHYKSLLIYIPTFRYYFDHKFLVDVVAKICNSVRGVNRVCQDITSKPPATVEWE